MNKQECRKSQNVLQNSEHGKQEFRKAQTSQQHICRIQKMENNNSEKHTNVNNKIAEFRKWKTRIQKEHKHMSATTLQNSDHEQARVQTKHTNDSNNIAEFRNMENKNTEKNNLCQQPNCGSQKGAQNTNSVSNKIA